MRPNQCRFTGQNFVELTLAQVLQDMRPELLAEAECVRLESISALGIMMTLPDAFLSGIFCKGRVVLKLVQLVAYYVLSTTVSMPLILIFG